MSLVYVDMDNVLVDFKSGMNKLGLDEKTQDPDEIEGIFSLMIPIPGAIEGYNKLNKLGHDVYILSTAPWENPSAWSDKLIWVKKYIGKIAHKKLILSHNKNLNKGDFLIDDRIANGPGDFKGELIRFGSEKFPNWDSVINYFENLKPN
jgi:5'(3')-deoxyribonucleotidase